MELYRELAALRCFTHKDIVKLTGSESAALWKIKNYLQKGYIERVRRDLYAVISMETGQAIPNRYQIVSRITDDACVSHHSAFEYYGYGNQIFYDVYFATEKRVRPFSYAGGKLLSGALARKYGYCRNGYRCPRDFPGADCDRQHSGFREDRRTGGITALPSTYPFA